MKLTSADRQLTAYYVYLIPLSIFIFKAIGVLLEVLKFVFPIDGINYVINTTPGFLTSFFEGFSIIYAFSLPIIITRVWDKFDNITREFNNEAYAIRTLYKDIKSNPWDSSNSIKTIGELLYRYVQHVVNTYKKEGGSASIEKNNGDMILLKIKKEIDSLSTPNKKAKSLTDSIISDLIQQINNIRHIRDRRVMLSQHSGVNNLRVVGLITSILFVVPLYFVRFGLEFGVLDNIIVVAVTILVIYIYALVEDLDEPFEGNRVVNIEVWRQILSDMDAIHNKVEPRKKKS
jgi:hypothetical protein